MEFFGFSRKNSMLPVVLARGDRPAPWSLLRQGEGESRTTPERDQKTWPAQGDGPFLCCRRCGERITRRGYERRVSGDHAHTCTNPEGVVFEVACFGLAPGCTVHGRPTLEHTWFAGYAWSFAACVRCLEHLGWLFTKGGDSFFGLIRPKLVEES